MSHEESISLEETNRIRISIGLKPLTDDKAPADSAEDAAEKNYAKQRERERKELQTKQLFDNIAKVKNKRELNSRLTGRSLADLDAGEEDVDDAKKWIKQSKKRQKLLAKMREEEIASMDKAFQDEYTEKDLEGLKVAHDLGDLAEGGERILTLKDSRILDDAEDELMNVEMAELERNKKNNDLKIKKPAYSSYDDSEFDASQLGAKRAVLAKYDEELNGSQETGFRLGSGVSTVAKAVHVRQDETVVVNKALLSIDYGKNVEVSDYLKEGDKGFKKPKAKKKRSTTRVVDIDPDRHPPSVDEDMEVDEKPMRRKKNLDADFANDDNDLQSALARARAVHIRKAKKLSPEEIAARIAEELAENRIKTEDADDSFLGEDTEDTGLVFDDTSEFVRAVQYNPKSVQRLKAEPHVDTHMSKEDTPERAMQIDQPVSEVHVKEEADDDEDEHMMLDQIESAIDAVEAEEQTAADGLQVGTSSEQALGSGLAGALSILRKQGIIASPSADQLERERVQRQRDAWLAEQRRRISRREEDRARARAAGSSKDQATREHENRMRDQQDAREAARHFDNYRPDIHIVYHDEFGRELSMKEAWKALSHRFHGKMPGRAKQEKRLKRIADERRREAMASGDTPLNMNMHFQARQEKAGQAHMVLSVGNRGAVPQAEAFLEQPNLAKKTDKKGKSKALVTPAPATPDITGFTANTLPSVVASASASPAPRAGFRRIGTVENATPSSPIPVLGAEGTKVALSLKRKAGDEGVGTPPSKRR